MQLRDFADQLLTGTIGVIAVSRAMRRFQEEVKAAWPELGNVLMTFVAIDSETDSLPIGTVREKWHPLTAGIEDQKVADAEARFGEPARDACRRVLELLNSGVVTLWRPVGPRELDLIAETNMREFPPRLPDQPIFYPVLTESYAIKIARDWNGPRGGGFVTRFQLRREYLSKYEPQKAGGREHLEYWIPAEELPALNRAIVGQIEVTATFPALAVPV